MIHLPRALKQDDFQQFGSMAFCIFSNFCWHYLKKKNKPSSLSRNKQSTKGHRTYNKKNNMHILSRLPEIHFTCWCLEVVIIFFFYQSTTCYLLVYTCCIWLVCVQGWTGKLACPPWCSCEELASCLNREAIRKYHMALSQAINILHENDTYMLK